jgi:hypothetical protein
MEEAKRYELQLPVEIKRTARIRCGGRVLTGAIAPRNSTEKENIPRPVRRSAHIRGMKRKDYKEASPEPKDYGGSDYSDQFEEDIEGYSGFMQIPIHPEDQHKTTFMFPYGTFAYRRMPSGLFSTLHDGRIFGIHRRDCRGVYG